LTPEKVAGEETKPRQQPKRTLRSNNRKSRNGDLALEKTELAKEKTERQGTNLSESSTSSGVSYGETLRPDFAQRCLAALHVTRTASEEPL